MAFQRLCRKHYLDYNQYNICVVIRIGILKYKTKSKQYVIYTRSHYKVSLVFLYSPIKKGSKLHYRSLILSVMDVVRHHIRIYSLTMVKGSINIQWIFVRHHANQKSNTTIEYCVTMYFVCIAQNVIYTNTFI